MSLKRPYLILDHDDTAVNSTATIHYPAHVEVMRRLRPDQSVVSLEEWWLKNFDPGVMEFLTHELNMDEDEVLMEYKIWKEFTSTRVPEFYPGFLEALEEYADEGGRFAVVSHSEREIIIRDYEAAGCRGPLLPEMVYGWDFDPAKRKPSPWPVEQILSFWGAGPDETLIVDDLRPAVIMSEATGVPAAAAGWSHDIPIIREYMSRHCVAYFSGVAQFRDFILASGR